MLQWKGGLVDKRDSLQLVQVPYQPLFVTLVGAPICWFLSSLNPTSEDSEDVV